MSPKTSAGARDVPWLVVLVLVAVFQILRGVWIDAGIFATALALAIWQSARLRSPRVRLNARPALGLLSTCAIVCGVLLALTPRHGIASGVVVTVIGVAALLIALLGGREADAAAAPHSRPAVSAATPTAPRSLVAALCAWGCLILVAGVWEATAYLTWKWGMLADGLMPSISDVLDPLLDTAPGKIAFVTVWLATGVALLRRGQSSKHAG